MKILLSILAILTTATGSLAPTSAMASRCIAIEFGDGSSPVIAARVNDAGPFAFVLDTGSSGTTIDDLRIKQLKLQPDGPSEQAQGMGGPIDVRLYKVRRFQTGPIVIRDMILPGVAAPSLGSHDIVGLAGVDIFGRNLATWQWDRSCVEIGRSGDRPSGAGWKKVKSRWLKPWKVLVPVMIGNTPGWGLLDTGAQRSILSPGLARAAGLVKTDAAATSGITGIDGTETSLVAHNVSATVGLWRYEKGRVGVAALPLFDRLGGMDEPVAVIGMDWMRSNEFAIDYGTEQVWQRPSKREYNN